MKHAMTRLRKRLIPIGVIAAGLILAAIRVLFGGHPSNIADFRPTSFRAQADSEFFYSTGGQLKYGREIDPDAPTLLSGNLTNFLVSPDNRKLAIVADGQLTIVGTQSVLRQVAPVESRFATPKPVGKQFFRDDQFQWSKDATALYLIHDEYDASAGPSQSANNTELWRYDLRAGTLQLALKPFRSDLYFFGEHGIFFFVETPRRAATSDTSTAAASALQRSQTHAATTLSEPPIGSPSSPIHNGTTRRQSDFTSALISS